MANAGCPGGGSNAPGLADRIAPAALILGAVLSTAGFLLAFLYASPVHGASVSGVEIIGGQMVSSMLLLSQKIFYFHMPVAIVSFAALVVAAVHVAFDFRLMLQLLQIFSVTSVLPTALCTLVTLLVFAALYAAVFALTARVYYHIVSR